METQQSTELTTRHTGGALDTNVRSAPAENVLASDVVLQKVLLCQGLSEAVTERKAQMGDIIRSTTREILGNPEKPVEFIPLTFKNGWIEFEVVDGSEQFCGTYERNARNEHDEWNYKKEDSPHPWKRLKTIDVFALLPADIEARENAIKKFKETGEMPDMNDVLLPVVISFRSTSYKAGTQVVTQFAKAQEASEAFGVKVNPYQYKMVLGCEDTKNDKGTFYIYKVSSGEKCNEAEVHAASGWYERLVKSGDSFKVDEASEGYAEESTTSDAATEEQF